MGKTSAVRLCSAAAVAPRRAVDLSDLLSTALQRFPLSTYRANASSEPPSPLTGAAGKA